MSRLVAVSRDEADLPTGPHATDERVGVEGMPSRSRLTEGRSGPGANFVIWRPGHDAVTDACPQLFVDHPTSKMSASLLLRTIERAVTG